jgi:hypothetical protein
MGSGVREERLVVTRVSRTLPASGVRVAVALVVLLFSGISCTRGEMRYEASDATYSLDGVANLVDSVDTPDFTGRPTSEAETLRHDQLVALRSEGDEAARLAGFLTATFPNESRSVPYYAEEAVVDGHAAWIVLEVWGPAEGDLDNVRLWVFDRDTGAVLLATSARPGS